MRLYLIRHADPHPERDDITEAGHVQARAIAAALTPAGIEAIYCSPMRRARATMEYTAAAIHVTPTIEEWMSEREWYVTLGNGLRRSAWNLPGEVIRSELPLPTRDTWWRPPLPEIVRAEFAALQTDSDRFCEQLGYQRVEGRYRVRRSTAKAIAVFAHGGFGLSWLAHLLEIPLTLCWSGFWLDPGSITTIHFEQHSDAWAVPRCLTLGSVSHLADGASCPPPSSIFAKFHTPSCA